MAKGRQQYFADEVSIQKEAREFAIEEQLKEKIDSIEEGAQVNVIETVKVNGDPLVPDAEKAVDVSVPLVEDTLYSVDTEAALSARQGKVLYDYILNLQSRGRYLSNWNCATGLPTTNPSDSPYEYRAGDYFLVSNVSTGTNYRPDGTEYVIGTASTTVETEEVKVSDMYIYDGTNWQLILNTERPIAIDDALSPTSTNPVENRVITQVIGTKQNIITDLQTIREGAALGATSLQPGDSITELTGTSDDITEGTSHLFMTPQERAKLGNQTGVNTGDETQATIKAKLGTASASTDGYLTSTDWNIFNNKQDAILDLATIRSDAQAGKNASDTIATYGDIVTHDVNEFATASQGGKADTAIQPGDNVSELTNDAGYITDAYHDSTKQDKLIAGANIQIAADGKTISATDTTYVAGDFDIKDLADSTGLRAEWSGKQDELIAGANIQIAADGKTISSTDTTYTAGPGISISQNNVISNTQTSAEWGNITGTLSDQTDLQNALNAKQDELTAGDNITIEEVCVDTSDMQGPAPDGFHVPLSTEWASVKNIRTALGGGGFDGINFGITLKMPMAGYRSNSSANVSYQGTDGYYWSSSSRSATSAYNLNFNSTALSSQNYNARGLGASIRCFKNSPTIPTSSWTKLYGTSIEVGGIFWSSIDGLISLSSDGSNWITIQDKNLGATTVYNDGDTLTQANMGNMYQWGNNYGFPSTGTITNTSSTKVDASNYGPGNYYSNDTFITGSGNWSSVQNDNLWGGVSQGSTQKCTLEISAETPDVKAEWGNITGTLSNQTDLQNALDGKVIKGSNTANGSLFDVSGTVDGVDGFSNYSAVGANWNAMGGGMDGARVEITTKRLSGVYPGVEIEDRWFENNKSNMYDTHIRSDRIDVNFSDGQGTEVSKTYNFLGNDRIATLSDVSGATSGAVSDASYDSSWNGVTTVAPSKNAVYDKLEADLNTKTFYLSSTSDLATAQNAYDWYRAGKNPIIIYLGVVYTLRYQNSFYFYSMTTIDNTTSSSGTTILTSKMRFSISSNVVTSINTGLEGGQFLMEGYDYSIPYTPTFDGNPATKKYVDDSISAIQVTPEWGDITGTLADQTDLQNALNGKANATDVNTKTFYLDGTTGASNIAAAQAAYDWFNDGKTPLLFFNTPGINYGGTYMLTGVSGEAPYAYLTFTQIEYVSYSQWTVPSEIDKNYITIDLQDGNVRTINRGTYSDRFLATGNTKSYTPTGDYNPATKKYVDDSISAIVIPTYTGGTGINIDANNEITVDTTTIATKADLANFAGFKVVATLPTTDIKTNIIYLLGPVGSGADKYEEYIYSNNTWIMIGDTSIDLTNYFNTSTQTSDVITEGSTNLFLTSAERTLLGNTSGTNTGDETKTSIQAKLGAASTSNSGYLTSTDWNTFNEKGDMHYADFNFQTKTGNSITLDLANTITPSANFTVNKPATLKDGQEYILVVDNGATAYTMTLGAGIENPFGVDLTLTENGIDQFVFLARGGILELQPTFVLDSQLNTKTFVINGTTGDNLSTLQAAVDWYNAGKFPILFWNENSVSRNGTYILEGIGTTQLSFNKYNVIDQSRMSAPSEINQYYVAVSLSDGTVTGATRGDYTVRVLSTNNYRAYTPSGDYNPATKKYVDDKVAAGGGGGFGTLLASYATVTAGTTLTIPAGTKLVVLETDRGGKMNTIFISADTLLSQGVDRQYSTYGYSDYDSFVTVNYDFSAGTFKVVGYNWSSEPNVYFYG